MAGRGHSRNKEVAAGEGADRVEDRDLSPSSFCPSLLYRHTALFTKVVYRDVPSVRRLCLSAGNGMVYNVAQGGRDAHLADATLWAKKFRLRLVI